MPPNDATTSQPPKSLLAGNPLRWLTVFGPGAIIASLTIGTGELIFSTRGGALFGYRILFLFLSISLLKWGLVYVLARHKILSGVHPYRRMLELPGPRGWLLLALFLLVSVTTPIWVGFHSGVLGNFTSWVTGTSEQFNGGMDYVWGGGILLLVLVLSASGGYSVLERVQMAIVAGLLFCAGVTLVIYNPDWLAMLKGALIPQSYEYPSWLARSADPEIRRIATYPVWVEVTRYVGVIGGASFDYLAYTTWLRDKRWGNAAAASVTAEQLDEIAADRRHPARIWLRAPLVDCTVSFALVVAFSAVFVASGVVMLGPNEQIPTESSLLDQQRRFVTSMFPSFRPLLLTLYVTGAFLTMLGSLYGTIEIGVAVLSEMTRAVRPDLARRHARRLKLTAVSWCAMGAFIVLTWSFFYTYHGGLDRPRMLLAVLTPANLFTGVLSMGIVCFLAVWMDRRFLPAGLRMPLWLMLLNVGSGFVFLLLGFKGYWDYHKPQEHWTASRGFTIGAIVCVFAASVLATWLLQRRRAGASC